MNINDVFVCQNNRPLFCGGCNVDLRQFVGDVGRFAKYFSREISPGTVILYIPNNFYLFCVCFFALLQAHKSVALPGMLTVQNAKDYADLTDVVVTDSTDDLSPLKKISLNVPDTPGEWTFTDFSCESVYFFTSGSTGVPKRIKKTISMLAAEVEYHIKFHKEKIEQNPTVVASIAPHHMYGVLWRVLFPIMAGAVVDSDMIFTPEELIAKQSVYSKILFITTPSFLGGITRYGGQYNFMENCIGIFTSGSLLDAGTSVAALDMFGVSPFEVFGSTETGGIAYRQQKNDANWTVFNGVNVEIKDGCMVINSPYAFQNPYAMSDAIDWIDEKHFKLLGRADRIVKIAEERISLPDMESWLVAHKYISRAYCCTMRRGMRDIIGCALELTDVGAGQIVKIGRRAFIDEIKKHLSGVVPAVALPRCVRIVNQIPTNAQGKFVKDEILAILHSAVAEPIVQNIAKTDTQVVADLTFLGDSAYFTGHFPNFPILPGVIQMHFVFMYLYQFFHVSRAAFDVVKLKYTALILPDVTTHFELVRLGDGEFSFCYSQKGKGCSAGKIVIQKGNANV